MTQGKAEELEAKITKTLDILEIQNLQFKYQQYIHFHRADKLPALFAKKNTPTIEIGPMGVGEGMDKVKEFFDSYIILLNAPGVIIDHEATCPVIEVAKDGKTAKGTFLSPGIGANGLHNLQVVCYGIYVNDYIKENGKWKIWHLRWGETFSARLEKGWVHEQDADKKDMVSERTKKELGEGFATKHGKPNKPASKYLKDWKLYSPTEVNKVPFEPPEPYDTWTE